MKLKSRKGNGSPPRRSIYFRMRFFIFAFFLLATPFVVYAAHVAVQDNSNNVEDWLPESFEETMNLRWFGQHFGTDSFLMISWEDCHLDDPRMDLLAEELRAPASIGDSRGIPLFDRVTTGSSIFRELQQSPLNLPPAAAASRLKGWILGDQGTTTGIVAVVSDAGFDHRHGLAQYIGECANRHAEFLNTEIRIAGSVLDSVEIDRASGENIILLSLLSFTICFLLMVGLLRSWALSGMILINALFCQQLALAVIYASGTQMDSILLMVPMLVFVLAVSTGVHLVNYYRDAVAENGLLDAPRRAVVEGLAPCWLASLTTALGVGSLMLSQLVPVQKFGWFASVGVIAATCVLFTLLPSQLEQTPIPTTRKSDRPTLWSILFARLHSSVCAGRVFIILCGFAITALGIYGVSQLRAGVRIHDMFSSTAKIIQDYDWLEEHIGPLVPFEVVLRFPLREEGVPDSPDMLQRLQLVRAVHGAARETDGIGAVVSALNFSPSLGGLNGSGTRLVIQRRVLNRKLEAARDGYLTAGLVAESSKEELWRISARAYAGQDVDYGQILNDLQKRVGPILGQAFDDGFQGISIAYCGGVPLVQKAQRQMLQDLLNSFLAAFVCIACVMGLLMIGMSFAETRGAQLWEGVAMIVRGLIAGLLAMIPSILPCVVVLGAMGLWQVRMEIGSMMTASVALGIAVDDTLHFLTWFRRGMLVKDTRREAVAYAYEKCGAAMIQTSVICGIGLLTYALSSFIPVSRFSWVMVAMLMSALMADLLLLPAMLLTPIGYFFEPIRRRANQ